MSVFKCQKSRVVSDYLKSLTNPNILSCFKAQGNDLDLMALLFLFSYVIFKSVISLI